jgi:hypothetical protein
MRQLLPLFAVLLQITTAYGQALQPGTVSINFKINGTAITMMTPPEFMAINDPATLKAFPYPENQNLYFIMKPTSGHESRYIAIGSRPELDAQDISKSTFTAMGKSLAKEMRNSHNMKTAIDRNRSLVDKWREKKGQPGFQAAQTLEATAADDAIIMTAVVLNKDGSEVINCIRMQHFKNRIIVMAVSSSLTTKADIAWVMSTASGLKRYIR